VTPSQAHVVVGSALPTGKPPASTTNERAASYAKPYPSLGGGEAAGVRRAHVMPFQVHVSIVASALEVELWMGATNRITLRALSYTIASGRGVVSPAPGGVLDGCRCVQLLPSHVHVSVNPPKPPNRTALPRAVSNASLEYWRAGGEVDGDF
jgi:hypothetical protein